MHLRPLAFAALALVVCPIIAQGTTQTRTIQDLQWGPAATVMMPADWRFDGMTSHGETCVSQTPGLRYAASSPDGSVRVQYYPEITYSYSSSAQSNSQMARQGCLITQAVQPDDFMRQVVAPELHRGAKVELVSMPGGPELANMQREAAQQDANMRGARQHTEVSQHGMALSWTYNGKEYVNLVSGLFRCTQTAWQSTGVQSVQCKVYSIVSLSAPGTQIVSLMRNSPVKTINNPAWDQQAYQMLKQRFDAENRGMQTMFANDTKTLMDLHAQLAGAQQAQYDAGMNRAMDSAKALHGVSQDVTNHMADRNVYTNPTTGERYMLSNQYKHTYQNADGTVLETNSAYAPGPATIWQELEPR